MKFAPKITNHIQDPQVRQILEFVLRLLQANPETNVYTFTKPWLPPFAMDVSANSGAPRLVPPRDVVLTDARVFQRPQEVVYTGAVNWHWSTTNTIIVDSVEGLVEGVQYVLTFQVTSE